MTLVAAAHSLGYQTDAILRRNSPHPQIVIDPI